MTHPGCTHMAAQARTAELHDRAAQARAARELRNAIALAATEPGTVTIRFARGEDAAALEALAELDSARPLALPILVAELDGGLRAALSLFDARLVADPFHPTLALTELLRTRARQLGTERDGGLLVALRHPRRTARAIRYAVATVS
jgi:hypothetical protein